MKGGLNMEIILSYIAKLLQHFAIASVDTTCLGPAYQPTEPDILKR